MEIITDDRILPRCRNPIHKYLLLWLGIGSKIDPLVYNEVTKTIYISSEARRKYSNLQIVLEVKRKYNL